MFCDSTHKSDSMNGNAREDLRLANFLLDQIQQADLRYGCVEVSLQSLGIPGHFLDVLDGGPKNVEQTVGILERSGFGINWVIQPHDGVTADQVEYIFDSSRPPTFREELPGGLLVGYLCFERYFTPKNPDHLMSVLPRDRMPRDDRKYLKRKRSFAVVDTIVGGIVPRTSEQLAHYMNYVLRSDGVLDIAQIRRLRD